MGLVVVLTPFGADLGQDVVGLLLLVFGIADHQLDHRRLQLRQRPPTGAELLQTRLKMDNTSIFVFLQPSSSALQASSLPPASRITGTSSRRQLELRIWLRVKRGQSPTRLSSDRACRCRLCGGDAGFSPPVLGARLHVLQPREAQTWQ